ncbi:molybdopterin-dependent oxidoreductase [Thioclava sp. FR2]|uniref:molybdopterin-dependent oxidoreductase n=1 Tax=Thioclava sp. FR2 TaxID=3445780 RepID=UPI003EBEDB46
MFSKHLISAAFSIAAFVAGEAQADTAVLIVSHNGEQIAMTMEELKAMPATSFTTSTQWTEGGPVAFTGVSLADFTAAFGVTEGTISATAINDYTVKIPVSDAVEGGPIIAYAMNGNEMSRRDKGPLWVIYPFDDKPDYKAETYYSRAIWQLDRVTFE